MSQLSNTVIIAQQEISGHLDKTKSIEENFRKAAKEAQNHWLAPNEKEAFDIAILAVSTCYGTDSPEFERITQEMKLVNALFFTPTNVPVDMTQILAEAVENPSKPIGIVQIWKQVKDE